MGGYGTVAMLLLAGWAALEAAVVPWLYIGAVAAFEGWLAWRVAALPRGPAAAGEPPYHFTDEEAALVGRYRFYFTVPGDARACASVLAAIGLGSMVLALWLTYKQAFVQGALLGLNLFAVARLTRIAAPLLALRMAAARGDRAALRMLELHGPVWAKIRAANAAAAQG